MSLSKGNWKSAFIFKLVGRILVNSIHQAGLLGVITRLRNPLELRFVIHQNPGPDIYVFIQGFGKRP